MSKKTLIVIVVILALILAAGIAAIFLLPNMVAPNNGDDSLGSEPAQTGEPVQQPGETDASAVTDNVDAETVAPTVDDPVDPTQKPDVVDPTKPTDLQKPTDPQKPTDTTKPTKPQKPTDPTKPTKPQPTEPEETEPEKPYFPEATGTPAPEKDEVTYLEYHSMTATEQKAFINTFESYDAFFEWHDAAKKAYEDSLIEIDGTEPIDLGDILGGN